MPFGLRNVRVTFYRIVQKSFENQIGRNVEAYVDDVVVCNRKEENVLADLREAFGNLRI
jgi:hypothetical protein